MSISIITEGHVDDAGSASTPFVAPVSVETETPAGTIDHVASAIARLPYQWRNSPNLIALISLFAARWQTLEQVYQTILAWRNPDNAQGTTLDLLGKLVGQPRQGLDDPTYRRYIRARIATNKSNGLIEDFIRIALLIVNDPACVVRVDNQGTAALVVRIEAVTADDAVANVLIDFLQTAAAAGVRVIVETQYVADSDTWFFAQAAFLSGGTLVGAVTLPVDSTAGFPASGTLNVDEGLATADLGVTYNGVTPTAFLNVAGVTHTHVSSSEVSLATGPGKGMGDTSDPSVGGQLISARDTHYP